MPEDFDQSKIMFTSDLQSNTENSNISYDVNNSTITGYYKTKLSPSEALTIRIELPNKYFDYEPTADYTRAFIIVSVSLILSIYIIKIRDKKIKSIETSPPNNLNSLELCSIYKGEVNEKAVFSLIVYLANKGYLSIEESHNEAHIFNKSNFKLTKIKDYNGRNEFEKMVMDALFSNDEKSVIQ